ncbi:predicted protein [Sclerotinia sclerotiorum 1980 UF-70]|uniref:Uncharacterized protein n=1 Tax=Sclerotinia sclerotiorum (strain ATCC 18683 / 1980 / Ss-1) TaxID=665079 RepID=A7F147_SCLS1|nr:predicted protein [Sclerotinia sclerotiorum 1980 UF-70]EDN95439.1 predicted protein [Sclerotinia sclerotiorum 1980 UF-70]
MTKLIHTSRLFRCRVNLFKTFCRDEYDRGRNEVQKQIQLWTPKTRRATYNFRPKIKKARVDDSHRNVSCREALGEQVMADFRARTTVSQLGC